MGTGPTRREVLAGAGIDVDRLNSDLATNAKTIDAILARNDGQAKAFGFRGTPSFIVGKFRVPGALTMAGGAAEPGVLGFYRLMVEGAARPVEETVVRDVVLQGPSNFISTITGRGVLPDAEGRFHLTADEAKPFLNLLGWSRVTESENALAS